MKNSKEHILYEVYNNLSNKEVPRRCAICDNLKVQRCKDMKSILIYCDDICSDNWENFKLNKKITKDVKIKKRS